MESNEFKAHTIIIEWNDDEVSSDGFPLKIKLSKKNKVNEILATLQYFPSQEQIDLGE